MAISLKGTAGAWQGGTTTAAPTIPSHAAGDKIVVFVGAKPTLTAVAPIFSTPAGWTLIASGHNNSGAAQGVDAGQTWCAAYEMTAASAAETISVSVTNGNVNLSRALVYQKTSSGHTWDTVTGVLAGDTSSGTAFSMADLLTIGANDMVVVGTCLAGNNVTYGATWTLSASGMTFGTVTKAGSDGSSNTGNDLAASSCYGLVTAGTSASVTLTAANTLSGSQTGVGIMVRLREIAPTVTGTAASTLSSFAQAAAGTRTVPAFTGTAAQSLQSFTQSAAGSFSIPPRTGTATSTLASFTQTAAGTRTVPTSTGTAASTLALFTQAASGTRTLPVFTGTGSSTLQPFAQSASGTRTVPSFTGTAASTLGSFAQTAAGSRTVPTSTGTGGSVLVPFTLTAAGTFTAGGGTAASTLQPFTQTASGAGTLPVFSGLITSTLTAFTLTAAGAATGLPDVPGEVTVSSTAKHTITTSSAVKNAAGSSSSASTSTGSTIKATVTTGAS